MEGTSWVLVDDELPWGEAEASLLGELAESLPPAYRDPGWTVRMSLHPAPGMDIREEHVLGRTNAAGRRVSLRLDGLAKRLGEGFADGLGGVVPEDPEGLALASRYLATRVVIHELTHVVDRGADLSHSEAWRSVGDWSLTARAPGVIPRETLAEFASPHGARSPSEDLATFAEVYFLPPPVGPTGADEHPKCAFPGKFRFFAERFPEGPDYSGVTCNSPGDEGLGADEVRRVEILWAMPSLEAATSAAGHLMLVLERETPGGVRLDTYSMVADDRGLVENSAYYLAMGLAGGFYSMIQREPLASVQLRYGRDENRDIARFTWHLDEEQEARLLARLLDLVEHWERPYYFFHRNCTELIVELAEAAGTPVDAALVSPPDLLLADLLRQGVISPVEVPASYRSSATRALMSKDARAQASADLCGERFRAEWSDPSRRDESYRSMLGHVEQVDTSECWSELARVLALSAPLEQTEWLEVSRSGEDVEQPGRAAALTAVRAHVSVAERLAIQQETEAIIEAELVRREPGPEARDHTPYVPLGAGLVWGGQGLWLIEVRRSAFELVVGEPRRFPSAKGVGGAFLDGAVAWSPWDREQLVIEYQVLRLGRLDEPLRRRPTLGPALRVVGVHGDLARHATSVEWAAMGFSVNILHSPDWRNHLDLAAFVAGESAWDDGVPAHDVVLPLGIEVLLSARGRPIMLHADASHSLLFGSRGPLRRLDYEAALRVGSLTTWDVGVTPELRASGRQWIGDTPTWNRHQLGLGLRFERY
ncbi:MAG TPA: DUF4105 domain-containing protein [Myxococcota bacterium]|nr:DUF4105 domain-containing protein [Myxococcota bacterium]